ncbi:MAG: FIST C-terminal domain-containing protein [Planctomycetes bacterium]|nr:FIST C-terminal domain-containing protein [Planctomycetota bacterium]
MSSSEEPRFASALSVDPMAQKAEEQVVGRILDELGGRRADLCAVFVSHHYGGAIEEIGARLRRATGARVVVGCTGESIIGGDREIEQEPALSVWCAALPGTVLRPFEVQAQLGADEQIVFSGLPDVREPRAASMLLLGDPYSFPMDAYLQRLNEAFPGVPAVGGMSSGGMGPGQNLLITDRGLLASGAIGVVLEGGIEVRSVVSQGCRPIGKPYVVTQCSEHMLHKLGGKAALEAMMETVQGLAAADQKLFLRQPFVGLAVDATKSKFERGDFLVRNVLGVSQEEKAVAVSDTLRRGQTVQFLVRDAASASEDLAQLMATQGGGALQSVRETSSAGALLFSCNGRGTRMFDEGDHDIRCVRVGLDKAVPVAGFFAQGEIGPIGGRNFLHGYTASVAVFRPRA